MQNVEKTTLQIVGRVSKWILEARNNLRGAFTFLPG